MKRIVFTIRRTAHIVVASVAVELALDFGAGALAIIRFRTVVQDTRDTAFVIFAVVVGMAVGTKLAIIALIGIPVVALAALLLSLIGRAGAPADCDVYVSSKGRNAPTTAVAVCIR